MFISVPFSENIFLETQIQFKTPERKREKKKEKENSQLDKFLYVVIIRKISLKGIMCRIFTQRYSA